MQVQHFYPSGILKSEGMVKYHYILGEEKIGTWKFYDEAGRLNKTTKE